uniref:Ovule protein n=1 Tax=Echinococcus canadensis TaxID=519352 RepID=A0A915EZ58_9CEST
MQISGSNNCYLIPLPLHKMLGKAPLSANSLAILDIRLNSVSNNKAYFCSLSNHLFITIFCSST